ncbi:hypothetical protein [Luedemannella helvata]|uniref:Uncharacterized protein n=1 Tax=Luedemannella helvata TaxID=349315 RepID=A0ABP4XJ30_9ACTN
MVVPLIAYIVAGLVAAALVGVVVAYWPKIMGWARDSLLPWADEHLPEFAGVIRQAFQTLDNVVVEVRQAVRSAWRRLRNVLLKETAEFVQLFNHGWAVEITSWLANRQNAEKPVVKVVTQQQLDYDDLPPDIRAQLIHDDLSEGSLDVTAARDRLLESA